jgi:hypothetical protein
MVASRAPAIRFEKTRFEGAIAALRNVTVALSSPGVNGTTRSTSSLYIAFQRSR